MHARVSFGRCFARRLLAAVCFSAVVAFLLAAPPRLTAQVADGDFEGEKTWTDKNGKTQEVKEPSTKDAKNREMFRVLRNAGKAANNAEQELFDNWAQSVVRPLTWKENVSELPKIRKDLKKFLLQRSKSAAPDLHDQLNALILQICTEAIKDARYPNAVRVNCVLMLGDLDQREHDAGAGQLAVPLPGATSILVELLADEKQPIAIRYVSMVALMRHIQPAMTAVLQGQIVEATLKIMTSPLPEGKQLAGQIWLRFRASDVLLTMIKHKLPIDQAALAGGLAALLADEKPPLWARAVYAGDLGKLDGKALPAEKLAGAVQGLDTLALAILQSSPFMTEEEVAEEAEEAARPSRGTGGRDRERASGNRGSGNRESGNREAAGGTAEAGADKKEEKKEEISPAAQKLLSEEMMWQLARIRGALCGKEAPAPRNDAPDATLGLYSAASDTDKAAIKKIVSQIDKCVKALATVPDGMDKLADVLRTANQELEDLFAAPAADQQQTAMADQETVADKPTGGKAKEKR
ncbi:MAG TPA: hypothetical protein VF278_08675 [Pirellulales bacterium]